MKNESYRKLIQQIDTIVELDKLKNDFISECVKRESKIKVSDFLKNIDNFGAAKSIFESSAVYLFPKRNGKNLINKYMKTIKENKSLKTLYAYHEGLNKNKTNEAKKVYITEALSITEPIDYNEYINGFGEIIKIISESFKLLGDDFVLNNIKQDKSQSVIGESLLYLSKTKKSIKNLNEYINHINKITENTSDSSNDTVNVDSTLEDIVVEMNKKVQEKNIDVIFNTSDKESEFKKAKDTCLEMIDFQKTQNSDGEILKTLVEMEEKLVGKKYTYETFTNDMLYMTELQEVLK